MKRGFTLIEIIAVIIILTIILTIALPIVNKVLENQEKNYYQNLEQLFLAGAKNYFKDNNYNKEEVTLEILLEKGYVKNINKYKDNKESCDLDSTVTYNNNDYKVNLDCK